MEQAPGAQEPQSIKANKEAYSILWDQRIARVTLLLSWPRIWIWSDTAFPTGAPSGTRAFT